ncbi:MAG: SufD family Fe-S cluster assembly protein, partial [Spirochaetia bacterium]|nr:SufD family Fe-S cluster assembly protein [Spirochaetia bacterium]
PNTTSQQTFKGILDGQSRAVFTGKVLVDKGARGSNSAQLSQTLLLGTKAQIDARPQLEILNNDVKCSHGATVGRLSDKEIFYLRSRGLTHEEASRLLCLGFIRELLEGVEDPGIRSVIFENFRRNTSLGRDL